MDEGATRAQAMPWRARVLRWTMYSLVGLALMAIGVGVWMLGRATTMESVTRSNEMATMVDIGRSVRDDIARVVRPAMERTRKCASDPAMVGALRAMDGVALTRACNDAVLGSTEIDAIALFDAEGNIAAINSVYASGQAIAPERVDRIMKLSFGNRDIIQNCVRNDTDEAVLEFQTSCDITPAFFDSTGLSVAYSLPVRDPLTGDRLGVVSARLRFERLTDLVERRSVGGRRNSVEFVTDRGGYFSEAINGGIRSAPIPPDVLSRLVAPLVSGNTNYSIQKYQGHFACLFRLLDFSTLDGGGIQVLLLLDEVSLVKEARQATMLRAGGVLATGIVLLPIAGLLRVAASLLLCEYRVRRLLETAMDAVVVVDGRGVVRIWNAEAERVFGYTAERMVGRSLDDFGDRERGGALGLARFLRGEDTSAIGRHVETTGVRSGGAAIDVEISVVPVPTDRGVWCSTFVRDITAKKRLQAQMVQSQKLESIGQLAAGIAHEINTPAQFVSDNTRFLKERFAGMLRVLDGYALAIDPSQPPRSWQERAEEVRALLQEVDYEFLRSEIPPAIDQSLDGLARITKIIRAMKDFSHPGTEEMEVADLNNAISSTAIVCENRWKYVADLALDLCPDLPRVPCHVAEFNQVVLNLIVNAADAIEERFRGTTRKGRISIGTRVAGACVEARVSDDGGGIPDAIRDRIFDPFFTTKEVGKGTGQGLSISRDVIVSKHGGELLCESTPGRGTTFVVRLPLAGALGSREAA